MPRIVLLVAFALCPTSLLAQPTRGAASTSRASLEGDVYLVMQNGDIKKGAGNTVYLIRDTPAARARIDSTCQAIGPRRKIIAMMSDIDAQMAGLAAQMGRSKKFDSLTTQSNAAKAAIVAALDSAERAFAERVAPLVVERAPTGMEAHYRFASIPVGRYLLYAETAIGDHHYEWWTPAIVSRGAANRVDLDNTVVERGRAICDRYPAPT